MSAGKKATTKVKRILNARPDTLDFRDRMYVPTLINVPPTRTLEDYRRYEVPILDQGTEGACTGFGLAAVVNYLLRTRESAVRKEAVSARMLYEMARRYDEWAGENYDGSSARGAMKGWHKHGVCSDQMWPYTKSAGELTAERSEEAIRRPLGAYFRVNHRDLVSMHSAICEVGILYATAQVHAGWDSVDKKGMIPMSDEILGGHAFAIVAYEERGFWIQNSWGNDWGKDGFAFIQYDDWLKNGTDVWVGRLGAPVIFSVRSGASTWELSGNPLAYSQNELRPHMVGIGNNGLLRSEGPSGTTADNVREIFEHYLPTITAGWKKKNILLYAHGGLVDEKSAIQRLADLRSTLLEAEVFPISFIWKSDYWTTLSNMLKDGLLRRTSGGVLDAAKDFMLDRLDDALEPIARSLTGKAEWDEMKENALAASTAAKGGARIVLKHLGEFLKKFPEFRIHVVGHSAGAIFHAPLVQLLASKGKISDGPMKGETGMGQTIDTCTLWAPACSIELFKSSYEECIKKGQIGDFGLFTLKDAVEQDDHCANIYHKSLLYLVSNAFEKRFRIPLIRPDGEPILGMEKFIRKDPELLAMLKKANAEWILTPNNEPIGSMRESNARHHGDFDTDEATLRATLRRIHGKGPQARPEFARHRSAKGLRRRLACMSESLEELRVR